jgi:hypothetical protein
VPWIRLGCDAFSETNYAWSIYARRALPSRRCPVAWSLYTEEERKGRALCMKFLL